MVENISEHELIARAQAGDIKAFEQLLFLYEKPIFGHIFRFVQHKENAEDLTQETFIKIYRAIKTFDPQYKFKTWVYTVATNTVYDWLRKAKKSTELYIVDDPDNPFETIDESWSYKNIEDKDMMERMLQKIKPAYQNILLLYYRDQLTYEDIAEVLNIPINTVKTNLRRAKTELQKYIDDIL